MKWEPLITHYTGDAADIMNTRKNFTVYKLSDYSEELAEQHGLNGVDGQKVRLNDLYARTKKVITEIPVIRKRGYEMTLIEEMEMYAHEHDVPIMQKEGIDFNVLLSEGA